MFHRLREVVAVRRTGLRKAGRSKLAEIVKSRAPPASASPAGASTSCTPCSAPTPPTGTNR